MQKEVRLPTLKNFFNTAKLYQPNITLKSEYPDNVKVAEVSGFDETFFNAYRAFEKSGKFLLQAIALYLGFK